jgi:hypothetical protein
MSKLQWDNIGERLVETGTEKGVVYPVDPVTRTYARGVAWSGLTKVSEAPEGAEPTTLWADDIEYMSLYSKEKYKATVEAYMYPDEIAECDGTAEIAPGVRIGQQSRKSFGFAFKSLIANDTEGDDYGYKLHLAYGCKIKPSSKDYTTVNDSPEGATFSWEMSTTPVAVNGFKPSATVVIDSTKVDPEKLKQLEDILYGTDTTDARLPLPDEVAELMASNPLTLNVDVNIPASTDLFGKTINDLQQDVEFTANAIAGTLKYVDDYTGFSSDTELQKGNFIVFHADTAEQDAKITVKITDPVVLDADRIFVGRIANKDAQTITITAEKEGFTTVTKVYSLAGLICEQPEG